MVKFRIFALPLLSIILSSCSPVYKVAHDYSPPTSIKGLACLSGCQSKLNQCNLQCGRQYTQCSAKAEQQAKRKMPSLLQAYPEKLETWLDAREDYRRDLDWYELQLDILESRRERHLHHCMKGGKKKHSCHSSFDKHNRHLSYDRPYFNLPRPIKPTLTVESNKIRKLTCTNKCGCDSNYRLCYTSCGGVVKSKKICIKNCQ